MAKSKLEIAADEARAENLIKNEYQESNPYDDTHKDALSDGDEKGIDTTDGGSSVDINGNGKHSGKSGRKGNIAINESKNGSVDGVNGYGPDKPYTTPIID